MDGEERKRELDESYGSMAAMDPHPCASGCIHLYPCRSAKRRVAQSIGQWTQWTRGRHAILSNNIHIMRKDDYLWPF